MFGEDFPHYQKPGFIITLLNWSLRQIRKTINNGLNILCRMTQQKSTVNHKVAGKITFEEDFMKFQDGNAGKQHHNKIFDANNRPELKVEMEEVDITQKKTPDWTFL